MHQNFEVEPNVIRVQSGLLSTSIVLEMNIICIYLKQPLLLQPGCMIRGKTTHYPYMSDQLSFSCRALLCCTLGIMLEYKV